VPRLIPALFGALALVASIHVLLVDPKLPIRLLKTPVAAALAAFIVYLFINATWSPDRAEGFAKAATVLGLAFGVVLLAASSKLRTAEEARVLAKSGAWPRLMQASAYGLFAVSVAVGISGFDIWQTWLLGALAFAWSAMMLAARLPALAGRTEAERGQLGRSGNAALPATIA